MRFSCIAWCSGAGIFATVPALHAQGDAAVERGRYIFTAAGCLGCHTREKPKGAFLIGDLRLETPFGAFLPHNITSDLNHGIGSGSLEGFKQAMRQGRGPDHSVYFPVFPYASSTGMYDTDLANLWAYLKTLPPFAEPSAEQGLTFPFSLRTLTWPWRCLSFEERCGDHAPGRSEM